MDIRPEGKFIRVSRRPRARSLKIILLTLLVVIIGIGVWVGVSAVMALKNITADSGQKGTILSLFSNNNNIKGQKEGRTNILLLGMGGKNHPGGLLSDTIMVASIDYKTNKLGIITIPRDLWAPIPGYGHAKINEAYADGERDKAKTGGGGALASKTVEAVLGIPIHYYVRVDFEGFERFIDKIGGIDVTVDKAIYDPYYPADNMIDYAPFRISAGEHHMDGELALKYARSRKTTSDFDRSRRQIQVMAASKEKVFSLNILANPKKITDLLSILGDHVLTNTQISEIRALWDVSKGLDTENIISKVLDTSSTGFLIGAQDSRGYYVYPRKGIDKFSEIQEMSKNLFSTETKTAEDPSQAKIEILNGSGTAGVAKKLSDKLKSEGYTITNIGNAEKKYAETVVYDYSGGDYDQTAKDLAKDLEVTPQVKANSSSTVDIQIILGEDYTQ